MFAFATAKKGISLAKQSGLFLKTKLAKNKKIANNNAENKHVQEIKNLKVVTDGTISAPTDKNGNQFSLFGQVHSTLGSGINFVDLTVENCYFNVNMSCTFVVVES